jgi:hypothetical protein
MENSSGDVVKRPLIDEMRGDRPAVTVADPGDRGVVRDRVVQEARA